MGRILKHKAISLNGEWVYGMPSGTEDPLYIIDGKLAIPVRAYTLCEFINRYDRLGRELYDNEIVAKLNHLDSSKIEDIGIIKHEDGEYRAWGNEIKDDILEFSSDLLYRVMNVFDELEEC
jgi:hypothetical protein